MAKKTFVVTHPKLYLKVKGKLALIPKDSELSMEPKAAASLIKQGKILVKGEGKKVQIEMPVDEETEETSETKA